MLKRQLQARHLTMIALGGSIGTGIFLGSGYAIHVAGPGGALAAYFVISIMVYCLITSLGEMATHLPTTGSFCDYAARYVSPHFGYAMSVNYWLNWSITVAAELAAAAIILQFWVPEISALWLAAGVFILILIANICSVKVYGESEYVMSFIKVAVILVFILLSIILLFRHSGVVVPLSTLKETMFQQGWFGFFSVFLVAGFAFQGAELIGVSAGEARDPNTAIPRAVKTVFWRLLLFYILTTFLIGLLLPSNDPALIRDDDVHSSPFTLVFKYYFGYGVAAHMINSAVLLAVVSAANASLYAATRTLWHMGQSKQVPTYFAATNRRGVPVMALLATAVVGWLVFMMSHFGDQGLFTSLVNISSLCGFIAWFGIALSHYYFRRSHMKDTTKLSYRAPFFPYAPILAMVLILVIVIGQALTLDVGSDWTAYIQHLGAVMIFLAVMLFSFFKKRT